MTSFHDINMDFLMVKHRIGGIETNSALATGIRNKAAEWFASHAKASIDSVLLYSRTSAAKVEIHGISYGLV